MIGTYLVHSWMHLFMVQVDYRLIQVGAWLMHLFMVQVDYRLYRLTWLMHGSDLLVHIYSGISHSDSVTVVPSFYFYFRVEGWARTGGCSHLPVVAREHRGL
jgi:hypothetical protein